MDQERAVKRALYWMKKEGLITPWRQDRAEEYIRELVSISFCEGTKHYGHATGKKIIQCDLGGIEIAEFENQLVAAKAVGYTSRAILRSLKSGKKTRAGHIWKYKEDEDTCRSNMGEGRRVKGRRTDV